MKPSPMDRPNQKGLVAELTSLLTKGNAHVTFEDATADLTPALWNQRLPDAPYTIWQLVEHVRIAQWDIVEFCLEPQHESPPWPAGYWPAPDATADEEQWQEALNSIRKDRQRLSAPAACPRHQPAGAPAPRHRPNHSARGPAHCRPRCLPYGADNARAPPAPRLGIGGAATEATGSGPDASVATAIRLPVLARPAARLAMRNVLLLVLLMLPACFSYAQKAPTAAALAALMQKAGVPGMQLVYTRGDSAGLCPGPAHRRHASRRNAGTTFEAASLGKAVQAYTALRLHDGGD